MLTAFGSVTTKVDDSDALLPAGTEAKLPPLGYATPLITGASPRVAAAPETAEVPRAARQEPELSLEGLAGQEAPAQPQLELEAQGAEREEATPTLTLEDQQAQGEQAQAQGPGHGQTGAKGAGEGHAAPDMAQQVRQAASAAAQKAQAAWKNAQPHVQAAAASACEAARASVKTGAQNAAATYDNVRGHMGSNGVLWLILIILTFPIWIGVLGGVFGALFGLIGGLCGLVLGGFGVILGGVLALVRSLMLFASAPMNALVNMGLSFVCIALGAVLAGIGVAIVQKLVPWVLGLIGRLVKWVSGKVGGGR